MSDGYFGDVTVGECWTALSDMPDSVLVDVRTMAEWTYVGIPALQALGKSPILAEWQSFPSMQVVPDFASALARLIEADGGAKETPIYFLCRSGVRSIAGARSLTAAGFSHCYNVLDGFEGPPDEDGHRGHRAGWKAEGLPWGQR